MIRPINTPVEVHTIGQIPIHVKREDLSWPFPPLSKSRGVWDAIERRSAQVIGVCDTGRSLNGALVASIAVTLGRKCIVGYPVYKADQNGIPGSALQAKSLGAEIYPIWANRQFVMRYCLKEYLRGRYAEQAFFLMPTGLRLPETVAATEQQFLQLGLEPQTIIVPTGTGTHLAGILRGLVAKGALGTTTVVAVQGYSRRKDRFLSDVAKAAGFNTFSVRVVDLGYDYFEVRADRLPPFPAHLHYECRAWQWLHNAAQYLPQPILLWNIGA